MLKEARPWYALLVISVFFPLTMSGTSLSTQQPDRIIELKSARNQPVKIVGMKNKRAALRIGAEFKDDEDWLRGFTIKISNTYYKAIQFVDIDLVFPRAEGQTTPPAADSLTYGRDPSSPFDAVPNESKLILPGESAELTITDDQHDGLRSFLKSQKYPESIVRISLRLHAVLFEEGTKWVAGRFFRRDEKDPDKWIPIENESEPKLNHHYNTVQLSLPWRENPVEGFATWAFRTRTSNLPSGWLPVTGTGSALSG
jgi:hypothetical protein